MQSTQGCLRFEFETPNRAGFRDSIVKKRLNLDASLYTLLQILSVTLFERMPLQQAFPPCNYTPPEGWACNQMNLFEI